MPTYFKPWRRKIGVVTLLMACVFAAGWVRSIGSAECLAVPLVPNQGLLFLSGYGCFLIGAAPEMGNQVVLERIADSDFMLGELSWAIPYWSIVIPLTMLSAWLLLSKTEVARPNDAD